MVDLLNDLTARLPDDTYLERLNVDEKNKVELQGLSEEASKLIGTARQIRSCLTNPSAAGIDPARSAHQKDRFKITAREPCKAGIPQGGLR